MILVIGEILVDMIGKEETSSLSLEAKLGGAPLNVASNLSDLGTNVNFYGVVGHDILGEFIKQQCKQMNSNLSFYLKQRKEKETTIAFFLKNKNSFQFMRKNGADFDFTKEELLSLPYQEASIIHFGSLFLSSAKARKLIFEAIKNYRKEGKLISFDCNFRDDIFQEENYISYYQEMITFSDIVKMTKEELLMITKSKTMDDALRKIDKNKLLLITDGEKGSYAYYQERLTQKETKKVTPIDTIGCGDSFMAGALSYLEQTDRKNLSQDDIDAMLIRGNCCGRKTCFVKGALHAYHSLKDIEK